MLLCQRPENTPQETDADRCRMAARKLLSGLHSGSVRKAADAHNIRNHSMIQYWYKRWKQTEYAEELEMTGATAESEQDKENNQLTNLTPKTSVLPEISEV